MVDSRLIDLSNFTNGMISGMSDEQISAELDLHELEAVIADDINFFNESGNELPELDTILVNCLLLAILLRTFAK